MQRKWQLFHSRNVVPLYMAFVHYKKAFDTVKLAFNFNFNQQIITYPELRYPIFVTLTIL